MRGHSEQKPAWIRPVRIVAFTIVGTLLALHFLSDVESVSMFLQPIFARTLPTGVVLSVAFGALAVVLLTDADELLRSGSPVHGWMRAFIGMSFAIIGWLAIKWVNGA